MSISLMGVMLGLPLALAMRGIMGKEKFEQWIESKDYLLYTTFDSMEEMRRDIEASGYDVTEWYGSLKTHLTQNKSSYFVWKDIDGKIVARMSVYDDKAAIKEFIEAVEGRAKKKIFYEDGKDSVNISAEEIQQAAESVTDLYYEEYPTIYVDVQLLCDIIERYQIEILTYSEDEIKCRYENYDMIFSRQKGEDPFNLEINSSSKNMRHLHDCIDCLNEDYYAALQEKTYIGIRKKIMEEGFEIEEEQVMEDNSIVMMISVG